MRLFQQLLLRFGLVDGANEPDRPHHHIAGLDGLRGVAILLVLLYHLNLLKNPRNTVEALWVHGIQGGWLGVDLFFVLSGFLITGICLDTRQNRGFFKTFFARRCLRIFPLYYLFLLVAFWVLPSLSTLHEDVAVFGKTPDSIWPFFLYFPNFLFALDGHFSGGRHFHLTWSLGIEEQFYLIWPFLIWVTPRRYLPYIIGGAIGLVAAARFHVAPILDNWILIFCHPLYHSEPLLWGALACLIYRRFDPSKIVPWACATWVVIVLTTLVWLSLGGELTQWNPRVLHSGLSIGAIGFSALLLHICTAERGSLIRWFFERRWLRLYGKYAYGIYLTHVIIQHVVVERFLDIPDIFKIFGNRFVVQCLYSLLGLLTSLLFGIFVYHLFEIRFLRLKRFFPYLKNESSPQNDSENQPKNESITP